MQKTNKQTTKQNATVTLFEQVVQAIEKAQAKDKSITMQKVTGYISVKYANKVLFELHDKKRSIAHLTFSSKQQVYDLLKTKKLIQRVVPASYGWKYNTECLLTEDFAKNFAEILNSVISEAVEARNLKQKKQAKTEKVATT